MQQEIWKDVKGYEGSYKISNLGNIKSLIRRYVPKEIILKQTMDAYGYKFVNLSLNSKVRVLKVHQLMAINFLNHTPNRFKGLVVDHINNIKTDNRLVNLRLITNRENTSDNKGKNKYTGVYFDESRNKYRATIYVNGKRKHLGRFNCEYKAHLKYEEALKQLN